MWWIMMSMAAITAAAGGVSSGSATAVGTQRSKRNIDDNDDNEVLSCEEARMKCAYRVGCGSALQNYMVGCSAVLQGSELSYCPEICQHSLIALTSTKEGKQLMTCKCSDNFCEDAKRRVEICRPSVVTANRNESVVSCRVAEWICSADALCSTALDYYNRLCRSMFHGRKCTYRCLNSISILRRQEKAAKLKTCKCDGYENYNCSQIQTNMQRLCYHKKNHEETTEPAGDIETNVIRDEFPPGIQSRASRLSATKILMNYSVGFLLPLVTFLVAVT